MSECREKYLLEEMGLSDEEQRLLRSPESFVTGDEESTAVIRLLASPSSAPKDRFHIAYLVYFTLGLGYLLPWNAFITAVDYFSYLYPEAMIDRVFSVAYMVSGLVVLLIVISSAHLSSATVRINIGLAIFAGSMVVVPVLDAVYVRNTKGLYGAFDVTVAALILAGFGDALVQGGVIGSAGELPGIYMQAVFSGTAASGVLVSTMRIICKAIFPQNATGLRNSANLYFGVSVAIMFICIICQNVVGRLPVIQHYKNIKLHAMKEDNLHKTFSSSSSSWRSTLWTIFKRIKWHGFGVFLIYVVTLSIFPGYITEDVHSQALKDWYPILLISSFNLFDLIGKALPAVYFLENAKIVVGACVARLLFYPLFLGCLHGLRYFRTEAPVVILTCFLGLTNGYFTTIIMILAPKAVQIQHSETAGIMMVLFLVSGLATGSLVSWFWVI